MSHVPFVVRFNYALSGNPTEVLPRLLHFFPFPSRFADILDTSSVTTYHSLLLSSEVKSSLIVHDHEVPVSHFGLVGRLLQWEATTCVG